MYLRFETFRPCRAERLSRPEGLFGGVDYDQILRAAPSWLAREIEDSLAWFDAHLERPRRLALRERRERAKREAQGYCWFRPEAKAAIAKARHLAWALEEASQPIRAVKARDPGEILWEDAQQIVAVPTLRFARGYRPPPS
ncbi:MAG: hypothetical protein AAGM38_15210 [Pseudomonadota bacterium]